VCDVSFPLFDHRYEPSTRSYFLTTQRNQEVASLWGFDLANDVGSASPLNSEVRFTYPESGASLVGIQAFATSAEKKAEGAPAITVLAFFNTLTGNCTVMNVNYQTGASTFWANLCNNYTRELTTAIEADHDNGVLYILTQALEGAPGMLQSYFPTCSLVHPVSHSALFFSVLLVHAHTRAQTARS
jgi:hypothetical protein